MNKVSVTVIIVTYNAEDYIDSCVSSLLMQEYTNFNILIIDNNSSDKTRNVIRKYIRVREKIVLIENQGNFGFSKACNIGIKYALGNLASDFVLLLNQDTIVQKNLLKDLLSWHERKGTGAYCPKILIRKNSKIWWIGTKFFSIGDLLKNPKLSVSYHIDKEQEDNFFFEKPLEREAITGCALFLPRKLIEDVGFFDERFFMYGEDLDYSLRSKAKGYKLFIIPGTVVYHDVDLENEALITGRNFERIVRRYFMHFSSSLLLLHKHFSFFYFLIWFSRTPFSGAYEILKRLKFVKRTN